MSKSSQAVKDWRIRTKERIIESMGGKCVACGYKKSSAALEIHHLYPNKKTVTMSSVRANPKSWESIVKELRHCVLVCANCHREIEYDNLKIEHKNYFDERYSNPEFFVREETRSNQHSHFKNNFKSKVCKKCAEKFIPSGPKQYYCSEFCKKTNPR